MQGESYFSLRFRGFLGSARALLFKKRDSEIDERRGNVLAASSNELSFYTIQAEEVKRLRGGEVVLHEVKEGEDLAGIASLYGLKKETIMWENNLCENSKLSVGSNLRILAPSSPGRATTWPAAACSAPRCCGSRSK